jgi:uncharacterized oligopeptide transporter (OPT) family protein
MKRRHRSERENKALLNSAIICLAVGASLAAAAGLHMLFGEPIAVLIVIEAWIVWALVAPMKRLTRRQQKRPLAPNYRWLREEFAASTRWLEMALSKQRGK